MTTTDKTDGRHQRSRNSQRKIVGAMLEIVREGNIAPTAEAVAQRACVGLRTVFRHFKDMDTLYGEMSRAIAEQVAPILDEVLVGPGWRDNLRVLLARRKKVFEAVMPYRVAANALRYQSHVMLSQHQEIIRTERARLLDILPERVRAQRTLINALEGVLSFDMWNELRNDQGLSFNDAAAAVDLAVERLLGNAEPA